MPFFWWSELANSNSSADPTINFAEGQPPSSLNDSSRALMAALRMWGNDISGAIVTSGTSTAYTVASRSVFDNLSHLAGQMIAFTPHATNGATVTLNVDGLGAKPLRSAPSVELPAGVLVQGTPYVALYNNSDGAFYLHGFYNNPYTVPIGGSIDFWGTTVPNSSFVFPMGQAINRTTFATLFSLFGTTFGVGDGTTTFNVPDLTGRVTAMKEAVATRITNAVSGVDGATMGSAGGAQSVALAASQIPSLTSTGTNTINVVAPNGQNYATASGVVSINTSAGGTPILINPAATNSSAVGSNPITVAYTNAGQVAVNKMIPIIICNKILRII
jgi:microcystin-dependent protein